MLQNVTPIRKWAPWTPNMSDGDVFCTAPARRNSSLHFLFRRPTPAIVLTLTFGSPLLRCRILCACNEKWRLKIQQWSEHIPLWCTQMGLNPWKIKWNQGHPGYWPPKCKNEIRGVQPHMLRKEKIISIISHPTEGFAKIKSRGSRNKIKKVPSQHPKCSRNKTEGFKVSICVCEIIWNLNKIYQILNPNISKPSF